MSEYPLVSVVTASYNMAQYVCKAVDSVLGQDYPNIEVIVVNDGSTDDTPARLAIYDHNGRVTVIHQQISGVAIGNLGKTVCQMTNEKQLN